MENVTLTQKEQTRLQVLNSLMADHMTLEQAATLMGVSTRHTRRILAAYRREGAAALAHGNRGRRPANATPDPLATDVVLLARTRYAGVNHTHLSELLREREGIDIGRNTLRKILTDVGVNSPRRRRPPKHRVRRQRMAREGMLIQVDGSYHRWLGEDGPQFTLLLAVDDATGCAVNALFCEYENTRSYLLLLRDLIQSYGIPLALYADRHGVFKHTPPSETAAAPTQFSRAMGELGVELIFARSPQAKGRVERTAGTLQDRLVTELRLAGATTIDDANRVLDDFLPRFNERFGVPSRHAETAAQLLLSSNIAGAEVPHTLGGRFRCLTERHLRYCQPPGHGRRRQGGHELRGVVPIVGRTGQIALWQRAVLFPLRPSPQLRHHVSSFEGPVEFEAGGRPTHQALPSS